jgi:hypothetical protein
MNLPSSSATRGVYRVPWIGPTGQIYYVAVDRHGHRVLKATVCRDHDPEPVIAALWELLDRVDPQDFLRLVG